MDTWLIIGGDSHIGSSLGLSLKKKGISTIYTSRREEKKRGTFFLDLNNKNLNLDFLENVTIAVICAGITSIQQCEIEPEKTWDINVHAICKVIDQLNVAGIHIIYLSSNQVFDGSASFLKISDPLNPLTQYGIQKKVVESYIQKNSRSFSIIRFSKIIDNNDNIITSWMCSLQKGHMITPIIGKKFAAIPIDVAIDIIYLTGLKFVRGIIQASGTRDILYEEVARYLCNILGKNPNLITLIEDKDCFYKQNPGYTTLDSSRVENELGITIPDSWETIDSIIQLNLTNY